jgi:fucose 4-O-acetylase-like acetyltransferase
MEEKKFRNKVGWFQFLCCVMVIWSHAGNAELFLGKAGKNHWLSRLEYVHFPAVMGVSIPCFFMISGYLFFRFFTFDQLTEKWKRRVQTLLIPYLCWNLLYYVGYLAGSRIPAVADIVNRPDLQFSLKEMLEALFFYDYNPVFFLTCRRTAISTPWE